MRELNKWALTSIMLAGMLIVAPIGVCQEQTPKTPEQPIPAKTEEQAQPGQKEDQSRTRAAAYGNEETPSEAGHSFIDSVFSNRRNPFGFSLAAYESYAHDSPGQNSQNNLMLTSFNSRLFTNFGRRRSRLHLNAGFGYGFDNADLSRAQQEYSANSSYSYQLTRKTSFRVSDSFFLSPNYYGSILQPIINPTPPSYLSPTYRLGQRQLYNVLEGSISRGLGRKTSIGLFGSYDIYRYSSESIYNADTALAGITFGYRPMKWMSINSSYSRYLNQVSKQNGRETITDIQFAGFDFRLSRYWRASASGGMQIAGPHPQLYYAASAHAGLSHSSRSNTLSISYYRGFSTTYGLSGLYQSNSAQVDFGQRLAERISFITGASYWKNGGANIAGGYNFWLVRTGLDFILWGGLIANLQYNYQYQTSSLPANLGVSNMNRNLAYLGIQYVWPGARR